ncbi:hypothetical protein VP1G_00341 [Cytospora mali]|uniref:F-box domain-containing protein n=1 Tax=Cytospora mali TaxID=578113 RepID=A0A194UMS3_CYTMA|nr:hypothetical protein VP1G_00341 [Valsa mali var. pyri (nom. inval.)]
MERYTTPSSSSLSSANTGESQMDSGTSSQQDCKSPTQIDGQEFHQQGREEFSQQPPSSIETREEQQDDEEPPQRPPSYSIIFPHNCPELQTPTPPGMDPLAAAAWHNRTHSPMHRLPDSVLTQIIDMLDNSGVECMRRVARRFPPLCEEIIYDRPRAFLPTENPRDGPFSWPRLRSMSTIGQAKELLRVAEGLAGLPADKAQLMRLLDKDWYCDGCRAAREAPDWEQRVAQLRKFLHCSVCLVDQPACLFSHSQRIRKPHRRVCIAHEGYLRIGGHKEGIVRWSDVLDYKRRMGPPKVPGLVPLQCKDDSHIVLCEATTMGNIGNRSTREPGCHIASSHEYIYPSFQLWGKRIYLDWTAHLPLWRTEWPITAAALRSRLAELRDKVGRFICPPLAPGIGMDLPELCCFDPNSCDCIGFEDSQNVLEFNGGHTDPTECKKSRESTSEYYRHIWARNIQYQR